MLSSTSETDIPCDIAKSLLQSFQKTCPSDCQKFVAEKQRLFLDYHPVLALNHPMSHLRSGSSGRLAVKHSQVGIVMCAFFGCSSGSSYINVTDRLGCGFETAVQIHVFRFLLRFLIRFAVPGGSEKNRAALGPRVHAPCEFQANLGIAC